MTLDEAKMVEMPFGKQHKGEPLGNIAETDPTYIDWLMGIRDTLRSHRLKEALELVAEEYAGDIAEALIQKEKS